MHFQLSEHQYIDRETGRICTERPLGDLAPRSVSLFTRALGRCIRLFRQKHGDWRGDFFSSPRRSNLIYCRLRKTIRIEAGSQDRLPKFQTLLTCGQHDTLTMCAT